MNWSLVISVLALLANAFTYFKHDKKLKKQEAEINELTLRKMKREEDSLNKAQLQAAIVNVTQTSSISKGTLRIQNIGKATAYNVCVNEHLYSQSGVRFPNIYGENIPPTCYIDKCISWSWDSPSEVRVQITWQQNDGCQLQQNKILKLD